MTKMTVKMSALTKIVCLMFQNNMDDVSRPGGDQKSSLLQKLLSE